MEWEEHQQPHDYFRYTRYGLEHLTGRPGSSIYGSKPVGGFFRLLSRRLMNSVTVLSRIAGSSTGHRFRAACALPCRSWIHSTRSATSLSVIYVSHESPSPALSLLPLWREHTAPRRLLRSGALQFTRSAVALRTAADRFAGASQTGGLTSSRNCALSAVAVEQDIFTAQTPAGPKRMNNIIAKVQGQGGPAGGTHRPLRHEDHGDRVFVGANDGGSSTGFLLEMARVLCGKPRKNDRVCSFGWTAKKPSRTGPQDDSLYGSRHLAKRWQDDGTLRRDEGHHQCGYDRRRRLDHHARMELDRLAAEAGVGNRAARSDMQRIFQWWMARSRTTTFRFCAPARPRSISSISTMDPEIAGGILIRTRSTSCRPRASR